MPPILRNFIILTLSITSASLVRVVFFSPDAPPAPAAAQAPEDKPAPLVQDFVPPVEIFPTGYTVKGRKINVQMSDGTIRTEHDEQLKNVTRGFIEYDGRKLYFKPSPRPPAPSLPPDAPPAPSPLDA